MKHQTYITNVLMQIEYTAVALARCFGDLPPKTQSEALMLGSEMAKLRIMLEHGKLKNKNNSVSRECG